MTAAAEVDPLAADGSEESLSELVSSMLSGLYREDMYLRYVYKLCRDQPESGPTLLGLIDRSYRLGRMPDDQFQKIKERIEQAMGTRPPAEDFEHEDLDRGDYAADEDEPEELVTRELTARQEPVAKPPAPKQPERRRSPRPSLRPVPSPPPRDAAAPVPLRPAPSKNDGATSGPQVAASAAPSPPPPSAAAPPPRAAAGAAPAGGVAAPVPFSIGTLLRGRYELLQLLGRGGMASVYKARDKYRTSLGVADCFVAIKIVQPHPSRPGSVEALGREFHNAQRLSHPNVVNVYDIDREGDARFYSMEYLDGERLGQLLTRAGDRLPRRYALAIIRDVGAAIAHAHSRGVVHSDVKPNNVMVTREGHVRVLDFGSGIVRPGEPWIAELSPGGSYRQATPAYASCEQLQGWCADPRDDIYALACLAYQLLAGRHPFEQRSALVARGRRLRPRRPPSMRGDHWRALRRGLSWSREQRNMTMEKWLEQLGVSEAVDTLPPLTRLTGAPPPRLWPQRLATAAIVLCSVGIAALAINRLAGTEFDHTLSASLGNAWNSAWQQFDALTTLPPTANESSGSAPHDALTTAAPASHPAATAPANPAPAAVSANPPPSTHPRAARVAHGASTPPSARAASVDEQDSAVSRIAAAALPATAEATSEPPHAAFDAPSYAVLSSDPAARITLRRIGGSSDSDLSFSWWTEPATAEPDVDYAAMGRRIDTIPAGSDKITVYVPIISNPTRQHMSQFYVAIGDSQPRSGGPARERVPVTIDRGD
ncbi:MAG TPA: protein kinase [Steroidobacteraceae bacterium]|jgi:serine/threonine protein kinase